MPEVYSPESPLVRPEDVAGWLDGMPGPIAVTGGTGFVGSHLIDTLCGAELRPRVLVRDPARPRWIDGAEADFVAGSLEDVDSLERLVDGAATVIHLAGVLRAAREGEFDRGNRAGTANLVRAVSRRGRATTFIHISSLAAAGPSASPGGRSPEQPAEPVSAYGRSKLAGENEVAGLGGHHRWCILRPSAVYGPRDTDILEFFRMAARGLGAIPSGERWLTMAYVADVVRAILAAAAVGGGGRVYHLGEPEPQLMERVLRDVAAAGGCDMRVLRLPPLVIRLAGLAGSGLQRLGMRRMPLTADKATELLAKHWTARTRESSSVLGIGAGTTLADGAAATWKWYRLQGWLR